MVADRVKAKGGALRDRKTCLNLRLDKGRQHGVYVSIMSTYVCVYFVVCNNWTDAAPYGRDALMPDNGAVAQRQQGLGWEMQTFMCGCSARRISKV
jgi:hypothetical protein